jgi:hypothetical protein
MVHTAVVLPPDLLEQLKKDGEAAGQGISTEIRERLRATYLMQNSRDPGTENLLNAIRVLAVSIERHYRKKWHEDPEALEAFKTAVQDLLARVVVVARDPDAAPAGPNASPDAVGHTLARQIDF